MDAIVAAWNREIPARRIRVITANRFWDLRRALAVFHPSEIVDAIGFYSRQSWQREHRAWMTFDAFLGLDRLTGWIEQMLEASERTAARKPVTGPAAPLARQVAAAHDVRDPVAEALARFKDLTPDLQAHLLTRARAELLERMEGREPVHNTVLRRAAELAAQEKKVT